MSESSTLWEAHKAYFQGQCISAGSRLKRGTALQWSSLLSKLCKAEKLLLSSPTVARLRTITSLLNQLKFLDMNKVAKSLLWAKQKFYEYSNKPDRMLVNRLKPHPFYSFPDLLMQPNGSPTYYSHTMAKPFGDFYHHLHNCLNSDPKYHFSQTKFDSFFASLHLPHLAQHTSLH